MIKHVSPFEDRGTGRTTVVLGGVLIHGRDRISCRIRNLSVGGCKIECDRSFPIGTPLHIDLSRFGRFPAVVAWHDGQATGLAFPEGAGTALARFGDGAVALGLVDPDVRVDSSPVVVELHPRP